MIVVCFIEETKTKILSEQQIKTWGWSKLLKANKRSQQLDVPVYTKVHSVCKNNVVNHHLHLPPASMTISEEENHGYSITQSFRSIFLEILLFNLALEIKLLKLCSLGGYVYEEMIN